jgi:hypothetical protein
MEKSMNLEHAPWTAAENERIREFVRDGVSIFRAAAVLNHSTISESGAQDRIAVSNREPSPQEVRPGSSRNRAFADSKQTSAGCGG